MCLGIESAWRATIVIHRSVCDIRCNDGPSTCESKAKYGRPLTAVCELLCARENRQCPATLSNNNDPWLTEIASEQTNPANEKKSWEISGTTFRTSEISVCRLSRGCFIADIKSRRAYTWRPSEQSSKKREWTDN